MSRCLESIKMLMLTEKKSKVAFQEQETVTGVKWFRRMQFLFAATNINVIMYRESKRKIPQHEGERIL